MKREYSWSDYYKLIDKLASLVKPDIPQYNQLLCLARGGFVLGDAFSRIFNLPLAVMFVSSYKESGQQGELVMDKQIAKQGGSLGDRILVLDDMVDSGTTLSKVLSHLKNEFDLPLIEAAVLWKKSHSVYVPKYFVENCESDVWIEQPFEKVVSI